MKKQIILAFGLFFLLLCSTLALAKTYDLSYVQYMSCEYSKTTQKYCSENDEPAWIAGSVKLDITDDSLVVFKWENKNYKFQYNRMRSEVNSDGDSILVITGQSKKGSKYTLAVGYGYFNLINSKKWGMYFLREKKTHKKSKLQQMDIGAVSYKTLSLATCQYNKVTEKYEDDCTFDNFKEVLPIEIRTRMNRDNLYLAVDTFPEINVTRAENYQNNENESVNYYSGVDNEGSDVIVVLGPNYFNFISNGYKLNFSEEKLSDDLVDRGFVTGSGVAVSQNIIVTNAHVTENLESLSLYLNGEKVKTDSIELIGEFPREVLDFAVVKVYGVKLDACPISTNEPNLGAEVFVYGYPKIGIQGNDLKVTKGIVSGKNGLMGNKKMFQMDAAIQPGNSGGPVVSKGKVIGLATSMMTELQNVNLGIKSSKMYHLLRFLDVEPKSNTTDFSKCTYLLVGER